MRRRLLAIAIVGCGLLSGCDLQQNIADRSDVGGANPTKAPQISAPLIATTSPTAAFSLSADQGHVVVVDFWGSWCGPCRQEQPDFNVIAARYQARGVVFVGVAMRDDEASVRAYLTTYAVPYPSVMDIDQSIAGNYNIASPPTTVVVDASGHVAQRFLGTTAGIGDELDALLAHP